ncbi:MAG: hypothetical protein M1812_004816 [Candelaria pacifica]|nr:MAG: hypothetical protein M1812_004816 [Candelaria pacifica]
MSASDLLEVLPLAKGRPQVHNLDFLGLSADGIDTEGYVLSETEELILSLSERLREIGLEERILRALKDDLPALSSQTGEEQLKIAEQEALEAKATDSLRNHITECVLTTDPTLKAVHSGMQASPVESALLPLIEKRDLLSMTHAQLSTDMSTLDDSLSALMTDNIRLWERNRELAQTLTRMAEVSKTSRIEDVKDARHRSQLELLKQENRVRKSRWRLMKGVVSTVVVGSAVDWARNNELRELVVDED